MNSTSSEQKIFVVAITGASGTIYGLRLLYALARLPIRIELIVSEAGRQVMIHETEYQQGPLKDFLRTQGCHIDSRFILNQYDPDDLFASPASGSFHHHGMIVAPCSMKTLAAIATGLAENLIQRAADVTLKEQRPLILLPRETPFSAIHLRNMQQALAAGATIMPPIPGFYFRPKTIEQLVDTSVARVLDHLQIDHRLAGQWGEDNGLSKFS